MHDRRAHGEREIERRDERRGLVVVDEGVRPVREPYAVVSSSRARSAAVSVYCRSTNWTPGTRSTGSSCSSVIERNGAARGLRAALP